MSYLEGMFGGDEKCVLKLQKCLWNIRPTETVNVDSVAVARKNAFLSRPANICSKCGLLLMPSYTHCTNCKRTSSINTSGEKELSSKCRPFDTLVSPSKLSANPQRVLDDYLQTNKFLDYLKAVLIDFPAFLMTVRVMQTVIHEEHISAFGSLTHLEARRHLTSLRVEHIQRWVRPILLKMMQHPRNANHLFNRPVDVVVLELSDYHQKIKFPMDLGTIRSRLQRGLYESVSSGVSDIELVFKNAISYNSEADHIYDAAKTMRDDLDSELIALDEKYAKEVERKLAHSCSLCLGSTCPLCGEKCLKFEPPVLVCHGTCSQKIKRNSVYYVTQDGVVVWCQKCYLTLPPVMPDFWAPGKPPLTKRDILKRKLDEEVAEPWVNCDSCGHWVHQICALYNDRIRPDDATDELGYQCPLCKLEFAASAAAVCRKQLIQRSSKASKSLSAGAAGGVSACRRSGLSTRGSVGGMCEVPAVLSKAVVTTGVPSSGRSRVRGRDTKQQPVAQEQWIEAVSSSSTSVSSTSVASTASSMSAAAAASSFALGVDCDLDEAGTGAMTVCSGLVDRLDDIGDATTEDDPESESKCGEEGGLPSPAREYEQTTEGSALTDGAQGGTMSEINVAFHEITRKKIISPTIELTNPQFLSAEVSIVSIVSSSNTSHSDGHSSGSDVDAMDGEDELPSASFSVSRKDKLRLDEADGGDGDGDQSILRLIKVEKQLINVGNCASELSPVEKTSDALVRFADEKFLHVTPDSRASVVCGSVTTSALAATHVGLDYLAMLKPSVMDKLRQGSSSSSVSVVSLASRGSSSDFGEGDCCVDGDEAEEQVEQDLMEEELNVDNLVCVGRGPDCSQVLSTFDEGCLEKSVGEVTEDMVVKEEEGGEVMEMVCDGSSISSLELRRVARSLDTNIQDWQHCPQLSVSDEAAVVEQQLAVVADEMIVGAMGDGNDGGELGEVLEGSGIMIYESDAAEPYDSYGSWGFDAMAAIQEAREEVMSSSCVGVGASVGLDAKTKCPDEIQLQNHELKYSYHTDKNRLDEFSSEPVGLEPFSGSMSSPGSGEAVRRKRGRPRRASQPDLGADVDAEGPSVDSASSSKASGTLDSNTDGGAEPLHAPTVLSSSRMLPRTRARSMSTDSYAPAAGEPSSQAVGKTTGVVRLRSGVTRPINDKHFESSTIDCKVDRGDDIHLPDTRPDTHAFWRASTLRRTKLGDFIEKLVIERLKECGFGDAASTVSVRLTSNTEQTADIPEPIWANMMARDGTFVPPTVGFKQKCILLFQNIDGVDVCLFSLYVQEFDNSSPEPNKGLIYISYLDSVDYFRPMEARTTVYHEILVGYLKWVQARGFRQGHIWACPPQRGDNFIFWSHPSHQRTPSRDRLNTWYNAMLVRSLRVGTLTEVTSIWNEYFAAYARKDRDENSTRQAAKNSYVGTGGAALSRHSSAVSLGSDSAEVSEASRSRDWLAATRGGGQASEGTAAAAVVKIGNEEVPVCPPVFEGDYWVGECLRQHRLVQQHMKGCDGQDRAVNARKCRDVLKFVMGRYNAGSFLKPVDPVALNIPTYTQIVTRPMDLGTIKEKLRVVDYKTMLEFAEDVRLTFENAKSFNPPVHPIHQMAVQLLAEFEKGMLEVVTEFAGSSSDLQSMDRWLAVFPLTESTPVAAEAVGRAGGSTQEAVRGKTANMMTMLQGGLGLTQESTRAATATAAGGGGAGVVVSSAFEVPSASSGCREGGDEVVGGLRRPTRREQRQARGESSNEMLETDNGDQSASVSSDASQTVSVSMQGSDGAATYTGDELARDGRFSAPRQGFEKPELGFKGAMVLMSELSKCVFRLKDDLFLIKFAPPGSAVKGPGRAVLKRNRVGSEGGEAVMMSVAQRNSTFSIDEMDLVVRCDLESRTQSEEEFLRYGDSSAARLDQEVSGGLGSTSHSGVSGLGQSERNGKSGMAGGGAGGGGASAAAAMDKAKRKGGRPKASSFRQSTSSLSVCSGGSSSSLDGKQVGSNIIDTEELEEIPECCQAMLADIVPDTSDPDQLFSSPFVDSRHTFLEMCQYRHYQFDSLRRAKHSSLMLLYHLHNPDAHHTRPLCAWCSQPMRDVRWHCEMCPNFDVCDSCYHSRTVPPKPVTLSEIGSAACSGEGGSDTEGEEQKGHAHPLTPFRVTFV